MLLCIGGGKIETTAALPWGESKLEWGDVRLLGQTVGKLGLGETIEGNGGGSIKDREEQQGNGSNGERDGEGDKSVDTKTILSPSNSRNYIGFQDNI
jgi:hypothetical protein